MSRANDPQIKSWIPTPENTDFPIQNIPFGVMQVDEDMFAAVSRVGKYVIDLTYLQDNGYFVGLNLPSGIFHKSYLNDFIALGKAQTQAVRERISDLLREGSSYTDLKEKTAYFMLPVEEVKMSMPVRIGDYTDFYSSREHATNVGTMFRDPANALLPNWLHLPVGYHGRASSIVISGTDIRRPSGQTKPPTAEKPTFGPTKQMDFELEMGFIVGKSNALGTPVSIDEAESHIFGMMLFNDWSARDIQAWEYVPLGPFLAKNFASTLSPWIVTMEALEPFRVAGPQQDPEVLPYLQTERAHNFDIQLQVDILLPNGQTSTVCKSNFKYMYWSMAQQLAHHTIGGCNMKVGDVCASGTISGPTPDSYGSMLELSWKGTKPLSMPDGTQRTFIEDGDTVILRGYAERDGVRIGFGECLGKVVG
ncbi:MAG: fumarylacetoacetase [Saprospiraceae bacterium]|nr:fumarylacetoacetase [Saprospiraceae bacterium]